MRPVVLCVAHSARAQGAKNGALTEYLVSRTASLAAFDALSRMHVPAALFDSGWTDRNEGLRRKVAHVNKLDAVLALELHVNASEDPRANYTEVLFSSGSIVGLNAAEAVCKGLEAVTLPKGWRTRGAQGRSDLYFLRETDCPALIVEPCMISNAAGAAWLSDEDGAREYGRAVANGVALWLNAKA